ncbi:MAG: pyruvate carboxyltransferase [Acidimicrobiia bacterium]|nr:pyruvate carboxyltransferase [Acidimicrobiia bacterium]
MSDTPWITEQWFSSPWNYLSDATGTLNLPSSLKVHDVTLRDGEQQAGVEFTADEKLRIAEMLSEAGIHRIEAGLPAVSPSDEEAVRRIAEAGFDAEIYAFSRCMVEDVKLAIDCGTTGVVMEVPSSHHLIEKGYRWPVERALDLSIEATNFAHENGLKVTFFPIDATRASIVEYLDMMERVATDGYVDAVALVDTFGVLSPHAVGYFVRQTRERLGVPMETHFHMDFGLGVANTILAVTEGVEVIQTTVTGLGERSGNTPTEETILALLTMYGLDTGIRTQDFTKISQEVLKMAGVTQPGNRPVVGDRLFNVESGIIATWVKNVGDELIETFPFHPSLVGQAEPEIVMGKGSGIDSVRIWLDRNGLTADDDQALEILAAVKAKSAQEKSLLSNDEFVECAQKVLG